jgi:hypothetical protein
MMTRQQIFKQIKEARRTMLQLAKLYPAAFDKDGKPIIAELRWPPVKPGGTP